MAFYTKEEISELEHLKKINFVNAISGFKSANLIGTVSKEGINNLAIFSSVVHLGSNPPVLGFILRPTTVPRDTYKNIKDTGYYSINHVTESFIEQAHHTSAKYSSLISEFEVTGLEPCYHNNFKVPFVSASPVRIAMKYVEEYHIKVNDVLMIVGEVQAVYVNDNLVEADGFVNLSKANVVAINGLDGYTVPKLKSRFEYQRPKN